MKNFLIKLAYSIGSHAYYGLIYLASVWKQKAKSWIEGRKHWQDDLKNQRFGIKVIWIHASSVGEFEQGRPIIEHLKATYPEIEIVLTFFSPSGYEFFKDYQLAHYVCYLPIDTRTNVELWLKTIQPKLVIFVKYDFWLNYLLAVKRKQIPLILVSAVVHPNMLKGLNKHFYQLAFSTFSHIFVQSQQDFERIVTLYPSNQVSISGDTRADQVFSRSQKVFEIEDLSSIINHRFCCIAGSMWQQDLNVLLPAMQGFRNDNILWIIVLHELEASKLNQLETELQQNGYKTIRWSQYIKSRKERTQNFESKSDVIIFDAMGLLFQLYRYADFVFVGGGFSTGIHNILEPLVWGKRIAFGPNHHKFKEAQEVIDQHLGICINTSNELADHIYYNYHSKCPRPIVNQSAIGYVSNAAGAKKIVIEWLESKVMKNISI